MPTGPTSTTSADQHAAAPLTWSAAPRWLGPEELAARQVLVVVALGRGPGLDAAHIIGDRPRLRVPFHGDGQSHLLAHARGLDEQPVAFGLVEGGDRLIDQARELLRLLRGA